MILSTTLCLSNADVPTLYLISNAEINKLYHWFCANKLMLNATKPKYIIIKLNQGNCDVVNMSFLMYTSSKLVQFSI